MDTLLLNLKNKIDNKPDVNKHLFEKGFLITSKIICDLQGFPFYGNWTSSNIKKFNFIIHNGNSLYTYDNGEKTFFLIGHAYNPFDMNYDENVILKQIAEDKNGFKIINQLTGIFALGSVDENGNIFLVNDASGIQNVCYGLINGNLYITSHMRLVGAFEDIETDKYVNRLINYRFYKFMLGNYLPGDITCYTNLKSLIPNTYVLFTDNGFIVKRFYPDSEIKMCATEQEYHEVIEQGSKILQNTMLLIPKKWNKPAISLTGGIDSNTTFAAANRIYDAYETFSYISMFRESVDAEKAKEISEAFGVKHTDYEVSENNADFVDFDLYKLVFECNDGFIGHYKDNDVRKKITLIKNDVCDVEVKSWVSETIRAYAYKYYGRKKFPKTLKPRNYTALFKVILNRKLCNQTDKYFKEYIEKTELHKHIVNYDETDFFVWEFEHGKKCSLDIGVMRSCFDITIPYNNRVFLDLLLRVPLKDRISDKHHLDMKKFMNEKLYNMNIRVVNLNETEKRKKLINLYYIINTHLPY